MYEGLRVTEGTGSEIAFDNIDGLRYQGMKLIDGTENSEEVIPGTTANGLLVDVSRIQDSVDITGTVTSNAGTGTFITGGTVAEGAALSGSPVRQGVRAHASFPTPVAGNNTVITPWADLYGAVVTKPRPVHSTVDSVDADDSAVTILAANDNRQAFILHNNSAATLYLKLGSSPSSTSYTWEVPPKGIVDTTSSKVVDTGIITGVWTAANGFAMTTECEV